VAISADLVRPSLPWLVGGGLARGGRLLPNLEASCDPEGFARLRSLCHADVRSLGAAQRAGGRLPGHVPTLAC
jgi:hypothetical protein